MAVPNKSMLPDIIRYLGIDPGSFIADEKPMLRQLKDKPESYPLPLDNKIIGRCSTQIESPMPSHAVHSRLVHDIANELYIRARYDVEVQDNRSTHQLDHTMSLYAFTEKQMLDFIRDVEDAVKERLAQ